MVKVDMREELERIRAWADAKIAAGQEPPWAWYQYMKLRETLDAILAEMDAVSPWRVHRNRLHIWKDISD